MKKLLFALLITFVGVSVQAQNKPLACLDIAVGGLQWENGRWTNSTFKDEKFILVLEGDSFTKESIGKVLKHSSSSVGISCSVLGPLITCSSFARQLIFNTKTLKGGVSSLFGSSMQDGSYKDSVYVQAFSCQPY
jgi:hypothetical protein